MTACVRGVVQTRASITNRDSVGGQLVIFRVKPSHGWLQSAAEPFNSGHPCRQSWSTTPMTPFKVLASVMYRLLIPLHMTGFGGAFWSISERRQHRGPRNVVARSEELFQQLFPHIE